MDTFVEALVKQVETEAELRATQTSSFDVASEVFKLKTAINSALVERSAQLADQL